MALGPNLPSRRLGTRFAVTRDTTLNTAITMMLQKRISCLPVVENDVPLGVLTSTDMMMALQCTLQILAKLAAELQFTGAPQTSAPDAGESDPAVEEAEAVLSP